MASLKELRERIATVKSTQKITKALQVVATAKLKRAQEAAVAAKPYAARMSAVIANLAKSATDGNGPKLIAGTGEDKVHLLVIMTAERGLCGGFNSNIAKMARSQINKLLADGKEVKLITVGKKGRDALRRQFGSMIIDHVDMRGVKIDGSIAKSIADNVNSRFEAGEFDVATLISSKFVNVLTQVPTPAQLIPAQAPEDAPVVDLEGASYIYEPSEEEILETLLPRYLSTVVLAALLETEAGFQGAQMTAMDNATRNAGDLIASLNLTYNRARQAQITTELIEIIAGAEAL